MYYTQVGTKPPARTCSPTKIRETGVYEKIDLEVCRLSWSPAKPDLDLEKEDWGCQYLQTC